MKWPSIEDQLLVDLTRSDLDTQDREIVQDLCRENPIDWESIYRTARMHSVAPLVYRNLAQIDRADLGMRNGSAKRFRRSFAKNLTAKRHFRDGLWKILGFFNDRDVDVMLIKGAAMNLFGNGSGPYTISRDVDLIVRAREENLPTELLVRMHALSQDFPLEYDFHGHHDIDLNGVLPIDWDWVWADAIPVHHTGRDFYIMSPEDALIAACTSACRKRYFNLKALCAIDAQLRTGSNLQWDVLIEKSRAYQVSNIVYGAFKVYANATQSPVPPGIAKRLSVGALRTTFVDLLARNFSYSSFSSLYSGKRIFRKKIGRSLLLPYATFGIKQAGKKAWKSLSI